MKKSLYLAGILILFSQLLNAQITAPQSSGSDVTQYPVFSENDDVFIFCTTDSLAEVGVLTVSTALEGTKTFLWEKYNPETAAFEFFMQESSDAVSHQITNLADGCYRASVTLGSTTDVYRAWVFNNWTYAESYVASSDCESFSLAGEFRAAALTYYDLSNNAPVELFKDVKVQWLDGSEIVSNLLNPQMFDPPAENTDYTLRVYDKYDCDGRSTVTYESLVPKANFTANPMEGETPLTVTFTNTSQNATPGYYEWFFYRDMDEITDESQGASQPVDSILIIAYDDAPVYTYQNSGRYLVKLVAKKISENINCVDTFALGKLIVADTSSIVVPNVFTPNGDGVNDVFKIKFESMKSIEITIVNRWGKRVHYWKSGDIQDPENARTEAVWDGSIGGRKASPGVYYYDVVGRGRDGRKQTKHGFIHLFRGKD
ncbi:gliding motility-associated C-terminal domain-containing protein [Maribellus sp. YY47]|uniref:gliding motility-associated C-terminal domain-containing protein n=1 Tax=Maribellus sp. YY47 TaxID=2929486 RepID=UPI00200104DC|nr:gliding motility-associated C-terminal domain-containing protein [Maribellus sp. YY47]MCK3684628.1 gliding motility-associated C-terminal domain-containing protein [Maribellus sp. YY47]